MGKGTRCGITAYMDENDHFDVEVQRAENGFKVSGIITVGGVRLSCKEMTVSDSSIKLKIVTEPMSYALFAFDGSKWEQLGGMDSKYLSTEVCEGFTGVIIGIYCEDDGDEPEFVEFEIK